jgi:hypothetical protein
MVIQLATDSAIHAQSAAAATVVLPVPPLPGNEALAGDKEKEQGDAVGAEA